MMQRLVHSRFYSSLASYWEVILIYPALFLYIFSNDLNLISQSSLIYRKLCLHAYNASTCDRIHTANETEASNRVQEAATQMQIVLNVAFITPAILSLVYLASLADRRLNYELPLVVSLLGSIAQAFMCIFAVQADYAAFYALLVSSQFVNGACGAGSLAFISSCFSHVAKYDSISRSRPEPRRSQLSQQFEYNRASLSSQQSNNQNTPGNNSQSHGHRSHRSIRFSICESCLLLGQFIGSILSGHLIGNKIDLARFVNVYIVSCALYVVVLIYTLGMFRYLKWRSGVQQSPDAAASAAAQPMSISTSEYLDSLDEDNNDNAEEIGIPKEQIIIPAQQQQQQSSIFQFLKDTWQLLTKRRANNSRFIIVSLLVMFFLGCSISMGIMSLQYLYVIRKPIHLSQIDYGYFKAFNTMCRAFALLVVLPVLKKFLRAPDYILFILGFSSEFLNLVVFSIAYFYRYIIWLGPVVYMFSNYFVVCIRSYSSRLVDKNETGKYFGLIGVTEFLVLLTSSSLFSLIYRYTVSFFPPLVFLLGCAISILICYPFLIFIIRELRRQHLSDSEAVNGNESN